ncbi:MULTISPECIES: hypothetical protein [Cupriavidus]|uniref:hypothetical protein n=1 Tax=Cupriavidus sp. DF5525 TaxID=3160989 RepID=UPI0003B0B4A7|nr:hypothetical protein N234_10375 [Ralstonia pickettii DTP0602]
MTIGLAVVAGLLAVLLVTGILLFLHTWRTRIRLTPQICYRSPPHGDFNRF